MEKTPQDAMEVEKEKDEKRKESKKEQEMMGAWCNQAS